MKKSIIETQKKYCSRAMAAAVIIGLILILIGYKPEGKGFILGSLFSVINFVLIGVALPVTIGATGRKTIFFSLGSIAVRFSIMAIPLVAAAIFDSFSIFTVIPGLLMVQMLILVDRIFKPITRIEM